MMPIHASFQKKAVKVHMQLHFREHKLMSLHKISPEEMAEEPDLSARRAMAR